MESGAGKVVSGDDASVVQSKFMAMRPEARGWNNMLMAMPELYEGFDLAWGCRQEGYLLIFVWDAFLRLKIRGAAGVTMEQFRNAMVFVLVQ